MKQENITNSYGDILGVRILEDDVTNTDPTEVAKLVAEYGIVVFKKTKTSIKDYHDWQLGLGYHQPAGIWCNDPDYPIFFLVTNRKVNGEDEGLFGHGDLDWHCNILFTPDGEEIVGLYGKDCQVGADTVIANSIPLWKNLPDNKKKHYSEIWQKISYRIEETYEKTLAHYVQPSAVYDDFNQKRVKLDITKSINFDPANAHLYPKPRCLFENFLRLKPNHPLNIDGIFFPHLNLEYLVNKYHYILKNHKEVYEDLRNNYVDSGRYSYSHNWETGDVVLMDQTTTIHRRNKMDPTLPRELIRTACWYKTGLRQHFDRTV